MARKAPGHFVATESAQVVRERLEASGGTEVTIPVSSGGDITIRLRNVSQTTAVGKTPEGKMVLVILGKEDDRETPPTILVGNITTL